jgi:2,5-diamino-6-(ribosylamino)-4(3H)-pyrimidinone 5'-phosphate reductase
MRPYVILNAAMTLDGKIDTIQRRGASISSPQDLQRVLRLRAESDAVMVGGRTLLDEDPKLTVKREELRAERRARGLEEEPVKVGIVTRATLKPDSRFLTVGNARKIIFTTEQTPFNEVNLLQELGADVFVLGKTRVDLTHALSLLALMDISRLMVEGGATLNFELLRLGLVDEVRVYVAPLIFGGETAPTLVAGAGWSAPQALRLQLQKVEIADESGGVLLIYRLLKGNQDGALSPSN